MALPARAILSRGMDARRASEDTFAVMRPSHNGKSCSANTSLNTHGASNRDISSRNCTKHNCRCDYQDVAAARGSPPASRRGPDLLMSPEIEMEIENWHRTGLTPYPELAGCPPSGWSGLSPSDLRLVHHLIGLSIDLHRRGLSNCTVWAQMLPR